MDALSNGNIPPRILAGGLQAGRGSAAADRARHALESGDTEALRDISREFESIFVHRLLQQMRKSVPKSDLLKGGLAMDTYENMMDQAVAKEVSRGAGIGLSEVIFRQLNGNAERPRTAPLQAGRGGVQAAGPDPGGVLAPPPAVKPDERGE